MATCWRIVKSRHASTAFDAEGARLYGGRWNSPGTRMVYTSGTISLAVLEILVHLQETSLLSSYSLISASFDDAFVERLDYSVLPDGWRARQYRVCFVWEGGDAHEVEVTDYH